MSATIRFIDGNTGALLGEEPFDAAPDEVRYVYMKGDRRVARKDLADRLVPIVRVVRFTFDAEGNLAPIEKAYNGFLKSYDADGRQVAETFLTYQPDATLVLPPFLRAGEG